MRVRIQAYMCMRIVEYVYVREDVMCKYEDWVRCIYEGYMIYISHLYQNIGVKVPYN